jgi:hypothetical protein
MYATEADSRLMLFAAALTRVTAETVAVRSALLVSFAVNADNPFI